MSFNQLSKDCH